MRIKGLNRELALKPLIKIDSFGFEKYSFFGKAPFASIFIFCITACLFKDSFFQRNSLWIIICSGIGFWLFDYIVGVVAVATEQGVGYIDPIWSFFYIKKWNFLKW